MSLPRKYYAGQLFNLTMMELRALPGEVIDRVRYGAIARIFKNGRHVASIVPPETEAETTIIHPDGSWTGATPLTFRQPDLLRKP